MAGVRHQLRGTRLDLVDGGPLVVLVANAALLKSGCKHSIAAKR